MIRQCDGFRKQTEAIISLLLKLPIDTSELIGLRDRAVLGLWDTHQTLVWFPHCSVGLESIWKLV
jgi:hypothetical protein